MKKNIKACLISLTAILGLQGCNESKGVRVGVTAGPHAIIMEKVKSIAATQGVKIDVIEFNDFILPNTALAEGDLDLNSYQHQPFLEEQIKIKAYPLMSVGKTVIMPMGIYAQNLTALHEIPDRAKIAIPNDPTNGGRALLLLQQAGLIGLKPNPIPSVLDIVANRKQLEIIELEAPQLPRTLSDVTAAVINTDWIVLSGMDPAAALIVEGKDSPYANVLVVKRGRENDPSIQKIVEIYHSDEIKKFVNEKFKGAVLAAW